MEHKKNRRYYPLPAPTHTDANWRYLADPQHPEYVKMVKEKIHYLLSPEGLDADGFEFDYTHFIPKFRGTKPITKQDRVTDWGVESLYTMIKLYYDSAKEAKKDALIISHTFNPYFNDITDMLRLQDIYSDNRSVVAQMDHRAQIAKKVCKGCVIHTDQHPMPSLEAWREYALYQPKIGNPCLYYVTGIETTREKFDESDYRMIRDTWEEYRKQL
jgi:glycosidase